MNWIEFKEFAIAILFFWILGILFLPFRKLKITGLILISTGTATNFLFIVLLWVKLCRPPLQTLGETRLWYSFFLSALGLILFFGRKYIWILISSLIFSAVFLMINYMNPENFNKTLMPALQSIWFIPHVVVYILAYSLLAGSFLSAVWGLYQIYSKKYEEKYLDFADNLVYSGFGFLTLGLIFGALWAKNAWGDYWTWDPKETWAFLTWAAYLIYIHFRRDKSRSQKLYLWILSIAFAVLLVCWFGINYLPSEKNSAHTYSEQ
jgi:ABC-type transport system involved in cytochrome c biogenesis permease subunit